VLQVDAVRFEPLEEYVRRTFVELDVGYSAVTADGASDRYCVLK